MRKKAWFFKDRTVWGILGLMLVFGMIATGCPTDPDSTPTTYTVTFDVDGGSAVANQTVEEGKKVTKPANPIKAGYTFANWYKDAAKTTLWNFDTDVVTANTTLYAKWVAGNVSSYTVTFDADGGSPAPANQTVVSGEKVSKPTDPTKAGYTFANWYKDAAKTTLWNFETDVVTANTTLYAKWIVSKTFTVTFSGFVDEEIDLTYEGGLTLSKSNWDSLSVSLSGVEGYDSIGWYEDGIHIWAGDGNEEYVVYTYNLSLGPHTLSVVVVKDDVPYSKTLTFKVSN